jgi:hypothetical protein
MTRALRPRLLAALLALLSPAALAAAVEVVRIGCVAPLTGPQAHLGKDIENGARLAIDEANAGGPALGGVPVRFELLVEDDQADPRTATVVAQKLVDSGVKGVVGHLNSGASIPASRIYAGAGIPQVSPGSTAVAYTRQGFKTTYRVMANDAQQGRALGDAAGVGVLDHDDGRSAAGEFRHQFERCIGVVVIVVGKLLALHLLGLRQAHDVRAFGNVERGLLVRVLAVAQQLHALGCQNDLLRKTLFAGRFSSVPLPLCSPARQPRRDRRVVSCRVLERL